MEWIKRFGVVGAACVCMALSACTQVPESAIQGEPPIEAADRDPLEGFNRGVYRFNRTVDGVLLRPVTSVYRGVVPEPGRDMVSNFINNIYSPVVFANSVLQGDPQNSFATLWRFLLNTSFGIGGLFDFASQVGLKNRNADLGQTLAMYGICSGDYLMLPLIGPSNVRDAFGRLGDAFMNPFNYIDEGVSISLWTATAIDARSRNMKLIDDIYANSLDPYSTFRSGYTQKRESDIRRAIEARDNAWKHSGTTDAQH